MKWNKKIRPDKRHVISALFFIAACIAFFTYLPGLSVSEIKTFIKGFGPLAPIIFIMICMGKPLLFFVPTLGLTVIAGTIFGPLYGTLYVALGGAGSTVVAFYLARIWGRKPVERIIKERSSLVKLDERMASRGFTTIIMLRVFNLPWDLVSYSAGLSKMRFRDFYLASLVMLLPISFLYTYFGSTVTRPTSPGFIISLSVIGLVIGIPYIVKRYRASSVNAE